MTSKDFSGIVATILGPSRFAHLPNIEASRDEFESLDECLVEAFGSIVDRVPSSRAHSDRGLERVLRNVTRRRRFDKWLVFVRTYASVFERASGSFCSLALRDSVRGRPAGMIEVGHLVSNLLGSQLEPPDFQILLFLDLVPLSTRPDSSPPPCEAILTLTAEAIQRQGRGHVNAIVSAGRPIDKPTGQSNSLAQALDAALRSCATAGVATNAADLLASCEKHVSANGAGHSNVVLGSTQVLLRPTNDRESLPSYVREDLFSPYQGSRIDAAQDLAALRSDGNEAADRYLAWLRDSDTSAEVRGYADVLIRRDRLPSISDLVSFGFIPDDVLTAAASRAGELPEHAPTTWTHGVMGVDSPKGQDFERPLHPVVVRPFRIAKRPITNLDYLSYLVAAGGDCPEHWTSEWVFVRELLHPVVMVSWYDAIRYCEWKTSSLHQAGILSNAESLALPTEAQWEVAARNGGTDRHPWGDRFRASLCNVRSTGIGRLMPVGSVSRPTADGVVDLIGNAWEWTASAWGESGRRPTFNYPYDANDGRELTDLPASVRRVIRGAAFYYTDECSNSYTRNRALPTDRHPAGTFRTVLCATN